MLKTEFVQRRGRNPHYSLRAFARDLGTDHSSLSQILRSRRRLSPQTIRRFGGRLRLPPQVITEACVQQNAQAILLLVRAPLFRTHSRWIATRTGIPLDAVNTALHWLLSDGKLRMKSANSWTPTQNSHA